MDNKFYIIRDDITVYCGDRECTCPSWASTVFRSSATTWTDMAEIFIAASKLRAIGNRVSIAEFNDEQVFLSETCCGEVLQICEDQVIIALEIDRDLVEQSYSIEQFNRLPKVGDSFEVRVQFIKLLPQDRLPNQHPITSWHNRRNVVPLPRTF